MKNYLVTIKIGKVITNKLVKAETAEEAEKEALRCASQETRDLQAPNQSMICWQDWTETSPEDAR